MESDSVVIIGAGHAASVCATSIREHGWTGRVLVIGEEPYLPYQRPPLSKGVLAGEMNPGQLFLRPESFYAQEGIEFLLNTRADRIDGVKRTVTLSDGREIGFTKLVIATGGRARRLNLPEIETIDTLKNFHYLRTLHDVRAVREQFNAGARLVIIGGGYVGLEVAAIGIKCGLKVTVLEAQSRVLARVTAPELSAFYEEVHRSAGVDVRTGTQLVGFDLTVAGDAISAVRCSDGSLIPADLVIAGVGLEPATEIAFDAGLEVDNGIVVDERTRTSDPDIFAIGDCTNHPNGFLKRRVRLESVPNAIEQARVAAAVICGKDHTYNSVPWFWSDQYDLKLKMVGLSGGYDRLVLRGSQESRSFSAFYLKGNRVLAADTVNRPAEFMLTKRLIAEQIEVRPEDLENDDIPLRSLLPPQQ